MARYFGCEFEPSWYGSQIFLDEMANFDDQQDGYESMDDDKDADDNSNSEHDSDIDPSSQTSLSEIIETGISDNLCELGRQNTLENTTNDSGDNDSEDEPNPLIDAVLANIEKTEKQISLKRQCDAQISSIFEEAAIAERPRQTQQEDQASARIMAAITSPTIRIKWSNTKVASSLRAS